MHDAREVRGTRCRSGILTDCIGATNGCPEYDYVLLIDTRYDDTLKILQPSYCQKYTFQ